MFPHLSPRMRHITGLPRGAAGKVHVVVLQKAVPLFAFRFGDEPTRDQRSKDGSGVDSHNLFRAARCDVKWSSGVSATGTSLSTHTAQSRAGPAVCAALHAARNRA